MCVLLFLLAFGAAAPAGAAVDEVHYTYTGPTSVAFDWRGSATDISYGTTTLYGSTATATTPNPTPFSSAGPFREVHLTGLAAGHDLPLLHRRKLRQDLHDGAHRQLPVRRGRRHRELAHVLQGGAHAWPGSPTTARHSSSSRVTSPMPMISGKPTPTSTSTTPWCGAERRPTCRRGEITSGNTPLMTTSATTRVGSPCRTRRHRRMHPRRGAVARIGDGSTPAACGSSRIRSRTPTTHGRSGSQRQTQSWLPHRRTPASATS